MINFLNNVFEEF